MISYVSLLNPASSAALLDQARKFPAAEPRGAKAAPFSSLLERAAQPAPRRERSAAGGEPEVRGDQRDAPRKKNRSRERDEPYSLAGAYAVNGSPVKPETPTQPTPEVVADNPAEAINAVSPEAEPVAALTMEADSPASIDASELGNTETTVAAANATLLAAETPILNDLTDMLTPTAPVSHLEPSAPVVATTGAVPLITAPGGETDAISVGPITTEDLSQPSSAKQLAVTSADNPLANTLMAEAASAAMEVPGETVVLMTAASGMTEVPLAPEAALRPGRAVRRSWPETPENSRGIGSAKLGETMKTVMNKEEIAGFTQQILPGSPTVASSRAILPSEARAATIGGISPAAALSGGVKATPAPARADLAGSGELLVARPATAMARISDVISREVRMFRRAGDDLVEVVLTPDPKTQISLRLQWREGQVEVQARCDLGDHQALNVQWPQLQAALAQHGVRLSHLNERAPTGFTEFFNNPNFSQQSGGDGQTPGHRSATRSGDAEPRPASAAPPVLSSPAKSGRRGNRRLESWA